MAAIGHRLAPVAVTYTLPSGESVSQEEFKARERAGHMPYGLYFGLMPGVGEVERFVLPPAGDASSKIQAKLSSYDVSRAAQAEYAAAITESPVLKFHLLASLLAKPVKPEDRLKSQALVRTLIGAGAEYLHLLPQMQRPRIMERYLAFFGADVLDKVAVPRPFLMYPMSGMVRPEEFLPKFAYALAQGVDPNAANPKTGTFLHIRIANEIPDFTIKILDILATAPKPFDYKAQDGEGKTCLFLAVVTRQSKVVEHLAKLAATGIDIGLEIPDHKGRTPLLVAAALGDQASVEVLLKLGARLDVKDAEGRGLAEYMHADAAMVTDILRGIHIEAGREVTAANNWLYWNDPESSPLTCAGSPYADHCVLVSAAKEPLDLIKQVCLQASPLPDPRTGISVLLSILDTLYQSNFFPKAKTPPVIMAEFGKLATEVKRVDYLEKLFAGVAATHKSLLTCCLENQVAVRKCMEAALRTACALGDVGTVRQLLAQGVNPNAQEAGTLRTAAHFVVMRSELVQAQVIDKMSGAKPSLRSCMEGHAAVLQELLKYDAKLDVPNKEGRTPSFLIDRDKTSANPLDQATALQLDTVIKERLSAGAAGGAFLPHHLAKEGGATLVAAAAPSPAAAPAPGSA